MKQQRVWPEEASVTREREGFLRFWFAWGSVGLPVREEAYRLGQFTPAAIRCFQGFRVLRVPAGIAWVAAVFAAYCVPRWLPWAGALPETPWVGAACLFPVRTIAGVEEALTPEILAHELAHVIWTRLPRELRRRFAAALAEAEARDPALAEWLDRCMAGYKERRSPEECHVRLLEYYRYGRRPLPEALQPFYAGWIEP